MIFQPTRNAISSQVVASGPSQLDLLAGLTTDPCGPVPVPASRSRRQAKVSEPMIQGICGRTFIASSVPAGPLSSWESRLRERLATVGSTESALIWREKVTPAGQSISRLAVSTRHTNGTGSIGSQWRSPTAGDKRGGAYADPEKAIARINAGMATEAGDRNRVDQLPRQMAQSPQAMWPTAQARDGMPAHSQEYVDKHKANGHGMANLNDHLALTAKAYMPTPNRQEARSWTPDPATAASRGERGRQVNLSDVLVANAMGHTGPTPSGSSATTAKRGAPNPVFAFWLMGFPDEWISGALEAMRSYRKPRRKS